MKNIKKIISFSIIAILAIVMSGCNMIAKTEQGIMNSTVAKVNDEKITRGQLEDNWQMKSVINQIKQQYGTNYTSNDQAVELLKQQKETILDQMITEKLLLQKAKELKLVPSDSEINKEIQKQYDSTKSQYKTDEEWKNALSQNGLTENVLKEQIKNSIIMNKVSDNITKDVKVTDKQIEDYYNANKNKYTTEPNKIHLAHILVKTENEAKSVKARIDKGEDFGKVAKEVSTDTGSKDNGGDLGDLEEENSGLDATFLKAALALKPGEVSNPVQTQYGWHVIKCISRNQYPVKKLDEVKDEIKNTLLTNAKQDKITTTLDKWKKEAKIKQYENNLN
ncbi:foldase protein PrsA [Clostridium pasteurianum DSM 525 = ATCC 6013]|uniref:Foldase protein PrsA n=1 Tax=Clostridium pasteurianum DSM 525 = ATCC 6013 TaxID=1262449 RepID=A0A0H3J8J7_CLOPA|nr:peptidylprolyl isomerase [Clostridium pasteurianum]AJA49784.1 foldase protein PrsA [Clostridium pasteurianum DSM 525 = ATCC 6013]AJA53772.1 foldase protein PrsA [Clostridium pasteurianum DSM 525 = ATCC 6013]AOZ76935.1 peptidylprolyl isomerase [Clostridium pasteurianum DSM 525 = ATCC 6013]AOZ80732.1 peptidylprolyl isomerase [Clostridium pasteurianum]ELP57709.1 peptidylprolyl isomerase [Clostridium pasteurianum DSM 525 = ATCC 6013]